MKFRLFPAIVFSLALGAACVQGVNAAPPASQDNGNGAGAGAYGQREGRGGFGGGMGMGIASGGGIIGTVTEVAANHYNVKSENGDVYTVHFSVNTRIFKQRAGMRGGGQEEGAVSGRAAGPEWGVVAIRRSRSNPLTSRSAMPLALWARSMPQVSP